MEVDLARTTKIETLLLLAMPSNLILNWFLPSAAPITYQIKCNIPFGLFDGVIVFKVDATMSALHVAMFGLVFRLIFVCTV